MKGYKNISINITPATTHVAVYIYGNVKQLLVRLRSLQVVASSHFKTIPARSFRGIIQNIGTTARSFRGIIQNIGTTARSFRGIIPNIGTTALSFRGIIPNIGTTARSFREIIQPFNYSTNQLFNIQNLTFNIQNTTFQLIN